MRAIRFTAALIWLIPICAVSGSLRAQTAGDLPDSSLTPGAVNPDVTAANIHQTICVPGWTKTIRAPASYTNKLKLEQMRLRGITGQPSDFEEDHLISIELAGHPTDPKNLWPQHWAEPWGARDKDATETALKRLVCSGKVSLSDAQHAISTDWIAAYRKYIGEPSNH